VVLVVGVVTWVAVTGGNDDAASSPTRVDQQAVSAGGPQVGDPVPDFTAKTLDGRTVKLSDYAGTPVVLNFWASWCNPCREEFPLFRDELAKHGDDYVMLGVDTLRDIPADARDFVRDQKARWPIALDGTSTLARAYGVARLPQTFFVKPDGTLGLRYYAEIPNAREFQQGLASILPTTS
jgi:cytochrome c biogenesis protein CcmG/thiol:disulfide interchange protein DsbE